MIAQLLCQKFRGMRCLLQYQCKRQEVPQEILLMILSLTPVEAEGPAHAGSRLHTHLGKGHGQHTFKDETAASSSALRALSRSGAVLR